MSVGEGPTVVLSRSRQRLPSRSGATPAIAALVILGLVAVLFAFSPTLNPLDILTGRFMEMPVPRVTGLTQERALIELDRNRLRGKVTFDHSGEVPRGAVIRQRPRAEDSMRRDGTVFLTVSRGPEFVTVPTLTGLRRADALARIRDLGLEVDEERLNHEFVPVGSVIAQSPTADTVVEGGSTVSIDVSTGPVRRTVPAVAGLPVEGASFLLGKAGFKLGTLTLADNADVRKGGIVGTDPPAQTVLPRDTPVNLVVSNGPPPVAVPRVIGQQRAAAAEELAKLGLVIGEVTQTGAVDDPLDGAVLDQDPLPGVMLRPGEVVTLTVRRALPPPPTLPPTTAPPAPAPGP